MKRLICTLFLLNAILLLGACAPASAPEEAPPPDATQIPDPDPITPADSIPTWDEAALLALFDELSTAAGYGGVEAIWDGVTIYSLPQANVYVTGDVLRHQLIYQRKDDGSWHYLDTGRLHFYPVSAVQAAEDDPDIILISCESRYFGFDTMMINYPCTLYYSLSEERVREVVYRAGSGVYGQESNRDDHFFSGYEINGHTVNFYFELAEDSPGNGHPGPEVLIKTVYRDDNVEGYPYPRNLLIAFRNTDDNLPTSFTEELRALPGLKEVTLFHQESPLFTGTVLLLTLADDYVIESWFNEDHNLERFTGFHLRPVQREGSIIEGIRVDGAEFYE